MRELLFSVMVTAVLLALVGGAYTYFSDVELSRSNVVQAGTLDCSLEDTQWSGILHPGEKAAFSILVKNQGTLPLDYEVTTSLSGELADAVEVTTLPSSGHLDVSRAENIEVNITLPYGVSGDYEGKRGSLAITFVGSHSGFSDEERSSGHTFTAATSPPTVEITSPSDGDEVSGRATVEADASDNFEVREVRFCVDGERIGTDDSSLYSVDWRSTRMGGGSHTITAEAVDGIGQTASDSIRISTP